MSKRKGTHSDGIVEVRKAYRNAREETRDLRKKIQSIKSARKSWFMNNIKFDCQLYRGDNVFPREEKITAREMGQRNRILVQKFIDELDKNEEGRRLWAWRLKDPKRFKKELHSYMNNF